jgi:DNA-binding GntR family transcriptional regulator
MIRRHDWGMTAPSEPVWLRIARDLCAQITDGHIQVGGVVPSREQLRVRWGVAGGTARRAIDHLRAVGVLEGAPGRGVYVRRLPTAEDLQSFQLDLGDDRVKDHEDRLNELEPLTGRLEANLIELYARMGQPYPGAEPGQRKPRSSAGDGR